MTEAIKYPPCYECGMVHPNRHNSLCSGYVPSWAPQVYPTLRVKGHDESFAEGEEAAVIKAFTVVNEILNCHCSAGSFAECDRCEIVRGLKEILND